MYYNKFSLHDCNGYNKYHKNTYIHDYLKNKYICDYLKNTYIDDNLKARGQHDVLDSPDLKGRRTDTSSDDIWQQEKVMVMFMVIRMGVAMMVILTVLMLVMMMVMIKVLNGECC